MEDNGKIEISTKIDFTANKILIRFSDNGAGIPNTDRDKLFLPHFTTKKRGTGLGLAIVSRIVADHGGTITVKNNRPHGTIFEIQIPRTHAPFNEEPAPPSFRKTTFSPF